MCLIKIRIPPNPDEREDTEFEPEFESEFLIGFTFKCYMNLTEPDHLYHASRGAIGSDTDQILSLLYPYSHPNFGYGYGYIY